MEHEAARLLRQLGYPARDQASLAKSVLPTTRGNGRSIWKFLVDNVKTPEEKHRMEAAVENHRKQQAVQQAGASRQQECAMLRAQLQQLELQACNVERRLAAFEGQVQHQVEDVAETAGKQRLQQQTRRDQQLQVLALQHASRRCKQMQGLLQVQAASLQQVEATASERCVPATEVAEVAEEVMPLLQQAVQQLTAELHSHAASAASSRQHMSRPQGGSGLDSCVLADYAPSPAVERLLDQLEGTPPSVLAACAAELVGQATEEAARVLSEAEAQFYALLDKYSQQQHQQQQQQSKVAAAGSGRALPDDTQEFLPAGAAAVATPFMGMAGVQLGASLAECWSASTHSTRGSMDALPGSSSGMPDPETLVKRRQQLHLRLALDTRASHLAAQKLQAQLSQRLREAGSMRLAPGQQRVHLVLAAAGLRAQVGRLQALAQQLGAQVEVLQEAEEEVQAKWQDITHLGQQDSELHTQLSQLGQYSTQLFDALAATTQLCHQQLQGATLPTLDGVAAAASSCKQGLGREEGAMQHLPLAALPLEHSSGDSSGRALLYRYQLASQQLCFTGRPSSLKPGAGTAAAAAAAAGAGEGVLEGLLVSALQAVQELDEAATLKDPATVLQELAGSMSAAQQLSGQVLELRGLVQQAGDLVNTCNTSTASAAAAVSTQREEDGSNLLPSLQAAMATGDTARQFGESAVQQALVNWSQQPGQHAVPEYKYEGKNCSDWYSEVELLRAHKAELTSAYQT